MALKIRLARAGSKKKPVYRIVVAEAQSPRDGRFVEKLGVYHPMFSQENPNRVVFDHERARHWIKVGAKPTNRVSRFLSQHNLISPFSYNASPVKSLPGKKAIERAQKKQTAQEEAS